MTIQLSEGQYPLKEIDKSYETLPKKEMCKCLCVQNMYINSMQPLTSIHFSSINGHCITD